jgi:hypothetical protein
MEMTGPGPVVYRCLLMIRDFSFYVSSFRLEFCFRVRVRFRLCLRGVYLRLRLRVQLHNPSQVRTQVLSASQPMFKTNSTLDQPTSRTYIISFRILRFLALNRDRIFCFHVVYSNETVFLLYATNI